MASEIDARLTRFGPRDVTVLGTNGLLRVLPHAQPLPPVLSMGEVTATLLGGPHPGVTQRAEQLVAEEPARKALWLTTGLDAGDGIITVFSSIRSAIALYMGRHGGKKTPAGWSAHQAGDAVLKAIALGYLLDLCFPKHEDPVLALARLPAGRSLLAYFAAAEVALPFVEILVDGEHALSNMLPEHADTQARKLATIVGAKQVQHAREHLPSLAPTVDALVACSAEHLSPFAKSAEGTLPGAGRVVDTVGDVMAAGADVLPVYRFLGLRVVAEAAVAQAAVELGVAIPDADAEWVSKYVDAPRRAALPLPASITATGWETVDDPIDAPTEPPLPLQPPAPTVAAPAVGAAMLPPPANPPAPSAASAPPPLPASHQAGPSAAAPPPLPPDRTPVPPSAPPPVDAPTERSAPPPLPAAADPTPPVAAPAPAVPPPLPAATTPAVLPHPVPADPTPPAVAPPVAVAPPLPPSEPKAAPPTPPVAAPPRVTPPPKKAAAPPKVTPPPKKAAAPPTSPPKASAPKSPPSPEKAAGGGFSFTAIGIAVAVVLLLGCAGVAGLGGVGAVFFGAHQETTDDPTPPKKTSKKASKKKPAKSSKKTSGKSRKSGSKRKASKKSSGSRRR